MSSLHINEAIKKRLFWTLKFHMSIVNPLLLQLYTFDWRNKYMIYMIYEQKWGCWQGFSELFNQGLSERFHDFLGLFQQIGDVFIISGTSSTKHFQLGLFQHALDFSHGGRELSQRTISMQSSMQVP